ncbi:MAG: YraN family protein [Tannerellaceae bacterium]|jgi:putative endonuclease|nr:YraN family protein [Tannerellaceae bacterium]
MAEQNYTGKEGEEEARNYLISQGYTIYNTNWRWKHYEIDIVAAKDGELAIVEVKTRTDDPLLSPEEAIDQAKIKRLVSAADVYARRFRIEMPVRFDIITLLKDENGGYEIDHLEDAFYAPLRSRR